MNKAGLIKNSRPCNQCLDEMIKYRIKKIIYSSDTGEIHCEKPEDMKQLHVSSGWKYYQKSV